MVEEVQRVEDWQLLAQFTQTYRTLSEAFMDRIGTHRAQAIVLYRLYAQDGMTQSEIAQQLAVQGATVTDILQRMEEAGFVSRRRDPEDNRLVRVYITELGREKKRFIVEQYFNLESAIFYGFKDSERDQLRQYLGRALDNLSHLR